MKHNQEHWGVHTPTHVSASAARDLLVAGGLHMTDKLLQPTRAAVSSTNYASGQPQRSR